MVSWTLARELVARDAEAPRAESAWLNEQEGAVLGIGPVHGAPIRCVGLWGGRLAREFNTAEAQLWPTFHLKEEGEVDIAYVQGRRIFPVEVKWTGQLRPKDLKQIARSRNRRIWAKGWSTHEIQGIPVEPLPLALALYRLGPAGA